VTVHRTDLRESLDLAGYYPDLVSDVLDVAVAGEDVLAHFVHPETMFDRTEVRRHVTVLVLTATRLVVAHVDDHPVDGQHSTQAAATTESVALRHLHTVALTHIVPSPEQHKKGVGPTEVTLALGWGAVRRIDLEPARCDDPQCEADHGLTGALVSDDIVVRVSAAAEGAEAVAAAVAFAQAVTLATTRS
jgi:hypothetical protein